MSWTTEKITAVVSLSQPLWLWRTVLDLQCLSENPGLSWWSGSYCWAWCKPSLLRGHCDPKSQTTDQEEAHCAWPCSNICGSPWTQRVRTTNWHLAGPVPSPLCSQPNAVDSNTHSRPGFQVLCIRQEPMIDSTILPAVDDLNLNSSRHPGRSNKFRPSEAWCGKSWVNEKREKLEKTRGDREWEPILTPIICTWKGKMQLSPMHSMN